MKPNLEQLLVEYYDLSSKIEKFEVLYNSEIFGVNSDELLKKQYSIMSEYKDILERRLDRENIAF